MLILLVRATLLYFLVFIAMKAMGKRELGQLQPFELVVILIISDMASIGMQSNTVTLASSIIPIVTITILQIGLSILNLKSEKSRSLLCGRPVMLIRKGQLQEKAMARLRLNINDIQEMSRTQGYFDISAIENAIMETNGQFSIMPKTAKRPLQLGDIESDPPQEHMGALLILDGHINQKTLKSLGYNENWLLDCLEREEIKRFADVFVAGVDESGQFFSQKKNQRLPENKR